MWQMQTPLNNEIKELKIVQSHFSLSAILNKFLNHLQRHLKISTKIRLEDLHYQLKICKDIPRIYNL